MITTFAEGLLWALIAIAATGIIVSIALIAALRKAELHTAELASRLARAEARLAEMDAADSSLMHKSADTDAMVEKICNSLTVQAARIDRLERSGENVGENVDEIRLVVNDLTENAPSPQLPSPPPHNSPTSQHPTLDAYNEAVHAFTALADSIASMKKTAKPAIPVLFSSLADYENGIAPARTAILGLDLSDDNKALMLNLASEIEKFHAHRRPVIDAWLAASPAQGIAAYTEAVRMPLHRTFDADLDEHIFQDPFDGCTVEYVHEIGYHFPGNTLHPFRKKSKVS